jgi:transcriptional regulator with XRE-family HTH domain
MQTYFYANSVSICVDEYASVNMNIEARQRLAALVNKARGGMTKSAFAQYLGVSHTAVGSWEQGAFMPEVRALAKICQILGCSVEEFLAEVDGKPLKAKPDVTSMIGQIRRLSIKQLAVVDKAVSERLVEIADKVAT